MKNKDVLLANFDKIHTTKMGVERIRNNLNLTTSNVVDYCKNKILDESSNIYKQGKNWYCEIDNIKITINSFSYTIITAHKLKESLVKYTIETERLILRKIREDDANAMFTNWASDDEVTKFLTFHSHKSIEDTKRIITYWLEEYKKPDTYRYGIVLKSTNELIGAIDVVNYHEGNPEIGYCLSKSHWNKGIMSEACKALCNFLFDRGYKEIVIEALENNTRSIRVIEKCGFKFTHKETKIWSKFKPEIITVNWYKKESK